MQIYHQDSNNLSHHKTNQIIIQLHQLQMEMVMTRLALDNKIIQ
jgi:hypothetical protein